MTSSPAAVRWSFLTASRIEYHVKKMTRKINATIGTLSGLAMISAKFSSKSPHPKNTASTPIRPYPTAFLAKSSRFQIMATSAATDRRKNHFGSAKILIRPLSASIFNDPERSFF